LFTQSEESYYEWFTARVMIEETVKSITVTNWWNSCTQSSWFKIVLLIFMHNLNAHFRLYWCHWIII